MKLLGLLININFFDKDFGLICIDYVFAEQRFSLWHNKKGISHFVIGVAFLQFTLQSLIIAFVETFFFWLHFINLLPFNFIVNYVTVSNYPTISIIQFRFHLILPYQIPSFYILIHSINNRNTGNNIEHEY